MNRVLFKYLIQTIELYFRMPETLLHDRVLWYLARPWSRNAPRYWRNALANHLRYYCSLKYQVEDFSKAKAAYEKYQLENNPLNNVEFIRTGDWVTVISPMYPVKGKQYGRYYDGDGFYAGDNWKPWSFQVARSYGNGVADDSGMMCMDSGQLRFATPREIEDQIDRNIEKELKKSLRGNILLR